MLHQTIGWFKSCWCGLFFYKSNNVIISYNELHGTNDTNDYWGMTAIKFQGMQYAVIEYNTIHDHSAHNFRAGIHLKGEGSYLQQHNRDIVIRYNNIYNLPIGKLAYVGAPAISGSRNTYRIWVQGNRIDRCMGGIAFGINGEAGVNDGKDGYNVEKIYIWGNSLSNIINRDIALTNSYSKNTDDFNEIFIINNSIYKNYELVDDSFTSSLRIDFTYGQDFFGTDDTGTFPFINFINNIISDERNELSSKHNLYFKESSNGDYIAIRNNINYDSNYSAANNKKFKIKLNSSIIEYNESVVPPNWFKNEIVGNPMYFSPIQGSLSLDNGSIAIDSGETIMDHIPSLNMEYYKTKAINFSFNDILSPETDWSMHPPNIIVGLQNKYGKPEIGAYVYPDYIAFDQNDFNFKSKKRQDRLKKFVKNLLNVVNLCISFSTK